MRTIVNDLGDERLKQILEAERVNALGCVQSSDLSEQRIKNYEYYNGEMRDMPANDGESSATDTSVQDVVEGVLPIILDALTSGENLCEFKPMGPGDEAAARQETDYVNHVIYEENNGFLILYSIIKDSLLQKNGFAKWAMEHEEDRQHETYEGLPADSYALMTADEEVTLRDVQEYTDTDPLTGQPAKFYNCVAETVKKIKVPRVYAMPPEEVLISKNSRETQKLPYWAHTSRKPQADVIELFPKKKEIIMKAPSAIVMSDNSEANARQTVQDNQDNLQSTDDINKEMRLIEVVEHYIRLPLEKDEIPRRYKITTVSNYEILGIEEVTSWPMATGTPIIMPHRIFGRALADLVLDVQQIKTALLRATLNNAYFANNQRTEVAETHATENTIDDLLNNRVGGIVRTKMPGGLNQLETQPIGHWTLPLIEHMNEVRENRTGVSRYNQGLDGDSLNHTATGITRIMDAAEMRIKLMTRVIAETLIVDMFRGVHEMLQEFGEEKNVVQLNGKWETINPREWKKRRHLKVTFPISGAGKQQLIGFFMQMLGVQKEVLMQQGNPNGPLVAYQNIYNTMDRIIRLAGVPSVDPFFMKPAPPNPNAPPPPNPAMVEAQAKAQATQAEQAHSQQLAQQEMQADQQQGQQKLAITQQLEQSKAAAKHQAMQDEFAHKQKLELMEFEHDARMEQMKAAFDMKIEAFKANEAMKLNAQQAKLSAEKGVGNV